MRLYTLFKAIIQRGLPVTGTFTPMIMNRQGSNPAVDDASGYTRSLIGVYTRVGNIVFFKISLYNFSITSNPGTLGSVGGLPFKAAADGVVNIGSTLNWGFSVAGEDVTFDLMAGESKLWLRNKATTNSASWQTSPRIFLDVVGSYIAEL